MKKTIAAFAIAAVSLLSYNTFAQAPQAGTCQGHCSKEKCRAQNRTVDKKKCVDLFEGLNLTDAQKEQISALNERQRTAAQVTRKNKQQADSAARAERIAARKLAKKQYLDEVKAILGPEQYVTFLENFYINAANKANKNKNKANKKGAHGDFNRHNRPERTNK